MWANTYIPGDAMQNSIAIVIGNAEVILDQWFSNWGPRDNFPGTAKHPPEKD